MWCLRLSALGCGSARRLPSLYSPSHNWNDQALFYSDRRLPTAPGPDTLRAALRAAAAGGDGELLLLAADRDAVVAAVDLRVVTAEDRYLYARIRPKS
jgi:hypothetical protein